jgi:adenine-specific DNA-methyltransferase
MRYIGSKVAMLPTIARIVGKRAPEAHTLCDPFAGTCTVSRLFKRKGFGIVTGDMLNLSYAFQVAHIHYNRVPSFQRLRCSGELICLPKQNGVDAVLERLNHVAPKYGYLTKNYSTIGNTRRKFFSKENASRLDGMRDQIESWYSSGLLSDRERLYLVAVTIDGADKVANTAGTYYAYLKKLSRRARKGVQLTPIIPSANGYSNKCNLGDARSVVQSHQADVLYLDPPYNERDYGSYYHLPETLALWDKLQPRGRSGVPSTPRQAVSDFSRSAKCSDALASILAQSSSRYILLHYARDGLIPHISIMQMLKGIGRARYDDYPVREYSTSKCNLEDTTTWHRIYWCDTGA